MAAWRDLDPIAPATCGGLFGRPPWPVNALQRVREILDQLRERQVERGAPTDQHIVIPDPQSSRVRKPHDFAQSSPYPVPLDRIADLLRDRKTDPRWTAIGALAGLQHEGRRGGAGARRDAEKIRPLPQSFHG